MQTIFSNAQFYNEEGSQVWKDSAVLSEHFTELMKEEPPEFHVRPRNKDQQQTQSQTKQEDGGFGSGRIKLKVDAHAGDSRPLDSQISYSLGQGGIENIAFADEFDDEDVVRAVEDDERDAEAKGQAEEDMAKPQARQSRAPLPRVSPHAAPNSTTADDMLSLQLSNATQSGVKYPAKTSGGLLKPKTLSRLSVGQLPLIKSFAVSLVHSAASPLPPQLQHVLPNTVVRQHTLLCSREVERIDIIPYLSSSPASPASGKDLRIAMRPQHTVADLPCSSNERAAGAGKVKWLTRPAAGLNVFEISTADAKEVYRLFINKVA